jgi:DNA-binding CsgD family transcriptional regulator
MKARNNTTWLGYIRERKKMALDHELIRPEDIQKLVGHAGEWTTLMHHSIPCVYLLDYTTGQYLYFSHNSISAIGIRNEEFREGGVEFTINKYHPQDLKIFNELIFPDRIRLMEKIPPQEQDQYVFSYNYRIFNTNGKVTNILQRNTFIKTDEQGKPLLSLGMTINIEHFKNPTTAVQLVERIDPDDPNAIAETVLKRTYHLNEEDTILSEREKELLKYMSEGLSSKQIAAKLYLSEHTVVAHRKNMLSKTNTANVAELLAFAIRKEII